MNIMQASLALCATLAVASTAQAQTPAQEREPFRAAEFTYGTRNNLPAGQQPQIWNTAKAKLLAGGPLIGGTVRSTDPRVYCAMAESGYDFLWVEKQHEATEWEQVARMWRSCPGPAAPGTRVAFENEKEIQIATDMGATVIVVPTVDTVEEAQRAADWTYFPPMGKRSQGGGQGQGEIWNDVPGGYRQSWNDNVVLILMIETLEGIENVREIAKVPGVSAVFAASGDLANFSGYREGDPEYERLIDEVAFAAEEAGVALCGPLRWANRPGFTCFQASTDTVDLRRGAQAEIQEAMAAFQGRSDVSAAVANTPASVPVADITAQCATMTYEADCYTAIEKALNAVKGASAQEIQAVQASLSDVVGKNPNHAARIREMVTQSGVAMAL